MTILVNEHEAKTEGLNEAMACLHADYMRAKRQRAQYREEAAALLQKAAAMKVCMDEIGRLLDSNTEKRIAVETEGA